MSNNVVRSISLAAAGTAALLVLTLTGCASPSGTSGQAPATESRLSKILDSKEIRIAVQAGPSPWSTLQASGEYEGFDVDLANSLAKSLGAKVIWVDATNETRIPLLQTNKADVVIASFSNKNERAQQVEMSAPSQTVSNIFIVSTTAGIKSYDDLAGKKVSASRGNAGEAILKENFPDSEITLFSSYTDALQALKTGKVDALMEQDIILGAVAAGDPNLELLKGPTFNPAFMVMGVKQGDQVLLNYLNNFIMNFTLNGENEAASQKWLGKPKSPFIYFQ